MIQSNALRTVVMPAAAAFPMGELPTAGHLRALAITSHFALVERSTRVTRATHGLQRQPFVAKGDHPAHRAVSAQRESRCVGALTQEGSPIHRNFGLADGAALYSAGGAAAAGPATLPGRSAGNPFFETANSKVSSTKPW